MYMAHHCQVNLGWSRSFFVAMAIHCSLPAFLEWWWKWKFDDANATRILGFTTVLWYDTRQNYALVCAMQECKL